MNITITEKELEAFVNEKVQSGAYQSADELVSALLRLLKKRQDEFEALRKEILLGAEDFKQGRFTTCSTEEELDEFFDEIIREGEASLSQKENGTRQ